jgi:phage terminase large subunit-like protein
MGIITEVLLDKKCLVWYTSYMMKKEKDNMNFVDYVESFYGNVPDAIYPIGATREMIIDAIEIYINSNNLQFPWGGGDSVDREHVRDIMIEKYNLEWK